MKKRRLLIIIPLLLFIIVWFNPLNKTDQLSPVITLEKKDLIQNLIKIEALPRINPSAKSLEFDITIESFQNQTILNENLDNISLVLINHSTPINPSQFITLSTNDYQTVGQLSFNTTENIKTLSLHIFDESEHILTWNVTTK